jgi:hypothetical protein
MAITFDAASDASGTGGGSSQTFAHTVGAGSNRLLVVGIGSSEDPPVNVSGVTYDGVAMTQVAQRNFNPYYNVAMYALVAPNTGTHNVVVTQAASINEYTVGAVSFFGVDQTTPYDTPTSADGGSSPATVSTNGGTGDLVVDMLWTGRELIAAEAAQTERWSNEAIGSPIFAGGQSTKPWVSSNTMSWTLSGSTSLSEWGIIAAPLNAAAETGSQKVFAQILI